PIYGFHQIKEHLTNLEKREQTLESWSILLPGLISKVCDSEPWIRSFCIGLVSSRLLFQENTPYIGSIVSIVLSSLNNLDEEIQVDAVFLLSAIINAIDSNIFRKYIAQIISSLSTWLHGISTPSRLQRMSRFGKLFNAKEGVSFWINFFRCLFAKDSDNLANAAKGPITVIYPLPFNRRLLLPPRKTVYSPVEAKWEIEAILPIKAQNLDELNALTSMKDLSPSEIIFAIAKFITTLKLN
ncbi:hypothetical protein DI09_288p10, partial [Mitosporidium daphniae]